MNANAAERGDAILRENQPAIYALLNEAKAIADGHAAGSYAMQARRMMAITDTLGSYVAPKAVCRKGCSHCCKIATTITEWEAWFIAKHTGRRIAEGAVVPPEMIEYEEYRAKFYNVPCTFLAEDGTCSIYEFRPLTCRTHFNLGDDPEDCNPVTRPGGKVSGFNFSALWTLQFMFFHQSGSGFGDIRDFFPKEPA